MGVVHLKFYIWCMWFQVKGALKYPYHTLLGLYDNKPIYGFSVVLLYAAFTTIALCITNHRYFRLLSALTHSQRVWLFC